jgi:hypothetical protein
MNHSFAHVFTLTSIPNALADASECACARGSAVPEPLPLEYGEGFGMNVRFKRRNSEASASGDCGARRTRTGVSPRTTLSNRDQQGVPVLLNLLPVDLSDDKAGSD